jgi:hypothetical protein
MSRQAYDIEPGRLPFVTAVAHHKGGGSDTHEGVVLIRDDFESRHPGPLPSLEAVRPNDQPVCEPVALDVIVAPSPKSVPALHDQNVLEELRLPLLTGFTVLLLVSLPFIAYVLSWRSGFDLTRVTYPLLATVLGGSAAAVWAVRRRFGSEATTTKSAWWARFLPWTSLQMIPIAGFELWRGAGFNRLEALTPLLAITWAFVAIVGLPNAQAELAAATEHRP